MADLDDFFAKKDRKKTKTKKFATPDEFVKKLEDTTKRNEVKPPRKEQQSTQQSDGVENESGEPQLNAAEEDEWREFQEEERNVDFTGLKIQNVQLNDDEFYSGSDADGGDGDGEDGDGEKGAWKKMAGGGASSATEAKVNSQAESDSSKKKPALSATSTGVYVSPALRQQQPLMSMRLKKDALPDINNEEYFPTLGDAKKEELRKKKNEPAFEEVKQGARIQRSSDLPTNAPVSIGNRYNSLADS
ncbi:protein CDV3 homolog [Contarinia nasturtii]|uniref:protein CDV3 homolog n=1 Tax=Contarinia nasturtii TaxID=265458 RepID=UPI0012D3A2A7|nr:protein CDV3 homolog [Contarinia nasturtii]XP_031616388.1 protein CDV3 homolog [Contarinia nasturtii]XP_031616389.1 protein CDV3 homolog [Contarinia nasturtii]